MTTITTIIIESDYRPENLGEGATAADAESLIDAQTAAVQAAYPEAVVTIRSTFAVGTKIAAADAAGMVDGAECEHIRGIIDHVFNRGTWATTATQAEQAVDRVNDYSGENIWQDIIKRLPGYDDVASEAADPSGRSDVAVFSDGSRLDYLEDSRRWVAGE